MTDWYAVQEIGENIFAIGEDHHWERVRSYLFRGNDASWLIDTGTGIGDLPAVVNQFTNAPVKVITTHTHWDHIGHHDTFETVYVHAADADWLINGLPLPASFIRKQISKEPFTLPPGSRYDHERYEPPRVASPGLVNDGDILESADFAFTVIHTPGHTPGSICLLEKNRRMLITGDVVYRGTIFANYESTDPVALRDSYSRLTKIKSFDWILPGHNDFILNRDVLDTGHRLLQIIGDRGLLCHGSGRHEGDEISFLF